MSKILGCKFAIPPRLTHWVNLVSLSNFRSRILNISSREAFQTASEARKVPGIQVINQKKGEIALQDGDAKPIIDKLVAQYERLFGKASHEAKDLLRNKDCNEN